MLPERFPAPATFAGRYRTMVKLRFAQKPSSVRWGLSDWPGPLFAGPDQQPQPP